MIHEKQVRQFCAIHAVNNLLQLPSSKRCGAAADRRVGTSQIKQERIDEAAAEQNIHRWTCKGHVLHECHDSPSTSSFHDKHWRVATQSEFDQIAQEITIRERHLMNGDSSEDASNEIDGTTTSNESLSIWNRVWSHHGTPYLGNYSLQVLQMALKRRGVSLDYFRISEADSDVQTVSDGSNITKKFHIGYVIYEQGNSYTSYLKQMGSYIPIVKHFCHGKHWYAITRMRYQCLKRDELSNPTNTTSWYLIDSKLDDVKMIKSDDKLMQLLKDIHKNGGLVFRACFVAQS